MKQDKIHFRLEKDEDGYPPDDWESMWATRTDEGNYIIDNIPFFVRNISCGDTVSITEKEGRLYFSELIERSLNNVIRVIVYPGTEVEPLRQSLVRLGCESELSHIASLIAVEVPEAADLDEVLAFLEEGEANGKWEYETGSLRT